MKKKLFILGCSVAIVALFFSGIVAFVFYRGLDKYNDTRLDPLQISKTKIDSAETHDIVLLGDSHAQFWKTPFKNSLNLGISGQTSEQILLRFRILEKEIKGGELLLLSVGANDVKSISTNPERSKIIIQNCLMNLRVLVEANRTKFKKMYIITIPPDFDVAFPYYFLNDQATKDAKLEINHGIRTIAKQKGLILIDAYEIFEHRLGKEFSPDGIHLNQRAYDILNKSFPLHK